MVRGGSNHFCSGPGGPDAASGCLDLQAAFATGGDSGSATLSTGSADLSDTLSNVPSGIVRVQSGAPKDARAGDVSAAVGKGGSFIEVGCTSEASSRGLPGNFVASAGCGGRGGQVEIRGGDGRKGSAGAVSLAVGPSEEGDGARASILAGATRGNTAGLVLVRAGGTLSKAANRASPSAAGGVAVAAGGAATVRTGGDLGARSGSGDASGRVHLSSHAAKGQGTSGALQFGSGTSSNGNSGVVNLRSGNGEGATGSSLILCVGTAHGGAGGDFYLAAGDSSARTRASGGEILLCCPSGGERDPGGALTLVAGPGYPGGDVFTDHSVHASKARRTRFTHKHRTNTLGECHHWSRYFIGQWEPRSSHSGLRQRGRERSAQAHDGHDRPWRFWVRAARVY